ncbi:hypothetical protein IU429_17660 [Nocardia elegans]|uniref:hypothetical protein n=1 Tax=Nocardia elegans TaxID=300029 RepID=UPI001895573F|nr:hypothetical protein [Nocardia elegans]MBF6449500.1 hypothetical protein [Nocardia elegans]
MVAILVFLDLGLYPTSWSIGPSVLLVIITLGFLASIYGRDMTFLGKEKIHYFGIQLLRQPKHARAATLRYLLYAHSQINYPHALLVDDGKEMLARTISHISQTLPRISFDAHFYGAETRRIVKDRFRGAGAAYQSYTLWVATPGDCTQSDLQHRFKSDIVAIATGKFDNLPHIAPRARLRVRLGSVVARSKIPGFLLLTIIGVVAVSTLMHVKLSNPVPATIITICALGFVSALNPHTKDSISAAKDFTGMIHPSSGK